MYEIYQELLAMFEKLGTVTESHLYPNGFITIDGQDTGGRSISITLCNKEKHDGDS